MAERGPITSGLNLEDDIPLADVDGEEVKDSSPDGSRAIGIQRQVELLRTPQPFLYL